MNGIKKLIDFFLELHDKYGYSNLVGQSESSLEPEVKDRFNKAKDACRETIKLVLEEQRGCSLIIKGDTISDSGSEESYKLTGSLAQGLVAEVPHFEIMNTSITNTSQKGVYIVYLLSGQGDKIVLALAHGTEQQRKEVRKEIVDIIRKKLNAPSDFTILDKPVLGTRSRAQKYEDSCAIYKTYTKGSIPSEEELENDFKAIFEVYSEYIDDKNDVRTEVEKLLGEGSEERQTDAHRNSGSNSEYSKRMNVKDYLSSMGSEKNPSKQVVFTGAPGTSKTYSVLKWLEEQKRNDGKTSFVENEDYVFVQFHPSYDYTDFVEGLRPVTVGGQTMFARTDGTFKTFCRHIVEGNLEKVDGVNSEQKIESLFNKNGEAIAAWDEACKRKYYFVIDEINRADLSKVFGELMFGLEEEYRGVKNRFNTQYQNLKTYEVSKVSSDKDANPIPEGDDCFKNGFFIPENLYIIGTMNDIDRSVETFDFALRRRFKWINVDADAVMKSVLLDVYEEAEVDPSKDLSDIDETKIDDVCEQMKKFNDIIRDGVAFGLNKDFCIGPAYLKKWAQGEENLAQTWERRVQPLLREYCRGHNSDKVKDFLKKCRTNFPKD